MTEEKEKKTVKTRSKLTLKLKPSSSGAGAGLGPNKAETRTGKNAVQVTIKGRKSVKAKEKPVSGLSDKEFEARFQAVSGTKSDGKNDDVDVLAKLKQEKDLGAKKTTTKKEIAEVEKVEKTKKTTQDKKIDINQIHNSIEVDGHDVMNKIKNSIAISNKEKEAREKAIEERRKVEEERIEREKEARAKQKKFSDDFDNDKKKKKSPAKTGRFNKRKMTYVNDEDSDEGGYRKRKRRGKKITNPDDYKKVAREVLLPDLITVADLSDRMAEKAGDVVKKLFSMGTAATSNQVIDADTAEIIIAEFGHSSKRVSHSDVENILNEEDADSEFEKKSRAPVVTIMGHVDHGKTSLLDAIRSTKVVDKEHGGITQHIGASRIKTNSGKYITFLDTPGHEAFTEMRSRGANATDIVILVVAADDGVKEQTVEAISHAKAAKVPIIVAVNKMDKPDADPSRVKNELLAHEIISEDMGGDAIFVEVSAKKSLNLDKLEDAILLQAEVLELKAPYEGPSSGIIVESRVDPTKGVLATVLVQKGSLDISDLIVVGTSYGKVRKMVDDNGKNVKIATPSVPVEILGLDQVPNAGDKFFEVDEEKTAREIILYRERKEREEKSMRNSARPLSEIFKESGVSQVKNLNVVVKADVHGSVEAIIGSITKLNNEEVAIKVIHQGTGGINESDISLAAVSKAMIIGFNVRCNNAAKSVADDKNVDIRYYSVIYNVVDDLKAMLSGLLDPTITEKYLGKAEIRQVFKISGSGKIAGGFVTDGMIKRNAKVRLLRDDVVIHDGVLKTLKRFKEDAKEVKNGFECGFSIENYEDIKEGDMIECYEVTEEKREL